jgi:hypothetical protein
VTNEPVSLLALTEASDHTAGLRAMASDLLTREWSAEQSRDLLDADPPAWSIELWGKVRNLGWMDILLDGGTFPDMCVVAEAVGASTAQLPFVSTAVANWCSAKRNAGEVGAVVVPTYACSMRSSAQRSGGQLARSRRSNIDLLISERISKSAVRSSPEPVWALNRKRRCCRSYLIGGVLGRRLPARRSGRGYTGPRRCRIYVRTRGPSIPSPSRSAHCADS